MMVTDGFIRLWTALALVLATTATAANGGAADFPHWLGLADLRRPSAAARVYPLQAQGPTPARLRYVPLAPPTAAQIACCLRPGRSAAAGEDLSPPVELIADGEDRPLLGRALTRRPRNTGGPMIALALAGPVPKVEAVSPQRLRLTWPGRAGAWRIEHCASAEGMHLRVQPEDGSAPPRAFYLPLGMEVEADCPADMLTPPAVPAAPVTR
jgi:hypothetical protein